MPYTKHHTQGIVLHAYDAGEADRLYHVLTDSLGLLYARAQGVRHLKSKHRAGLQLFSQGELSLVRGKAGWRITNVSSQQSHYHTLQADPRKAQALTRYVSLVRRLVRGEEPHATLFQEYGAFAGALVEVSLDSKVLAQLEQLAALRLLYILGYVEADERFAPLLAEEGAFADVQLRALKDEQRRVVAAINHALEASQL